MNDATSYFFPFPATRCFHLRRGLGMHASRAIDDPWPLGTAWLEGVKG